MLKSLSNLHHAYLVVGDSERAEEDLHQVFKAQGLVLRGSPDFFVFKDETFGIDEARKRSEKAIRRAFGERKVFLIAPEKITLEAQNALLKTFEEPIADTHFFLVVRDQHVIVPTLLSRLQVVRLDESSSDLKEGEKFLKLGVKERLNFVKKFVDDEKNLSKFLDELLIILRDNKENLEQIKKVYEARLVSDDRGTSARLILEHLALVL